jgi:uncharacterized protein (TIGR02186 family)
MRTAATIALVGLVVLLRSAAAQDSPPPAAAPAEPAAAPVEGAVAQQGPAERIQIGLSTDRISITSDFSGTELAIIGALENADPQVLRQGRYDVIVVLEGPPRPVVVRRKDRVLGVWINTQSETFVNVPSSYSVATTRVYQDITTTDSYRQLSLGPDYIHMQPADPNQPQATIDEFERALREQKKSTGQYSERIGGVQFLSQSLFRATVSLPANVPLGTHRARAFLFRAGLFVGESSAALGIYKAGFEQRMFEASRNNGFLFGLGAVAIAMLTGWAGSIVFRRE